MPPLTKGFAPGKLAPHFVKHGPALGIGTEADYADRADAFMGSRLTVQVMECSRSNKDRLRMNLKTGEFGAMSATGVIRTYMKADPAEHGAKSNLAYFQARCKD